MGYAMPDDTRTGRWRITVTVGKDLYDSLHQEARQQNIGVSSLAKRLIQTGRNAVLASEASTARTNSDGTSLAAFESWIGGGS